MQVLEESIIETMKTQEFGGELLKTQGLDPKRLFDVAPMDDGQNPEIPDRVTVTSFLKALAVGFTRPHTRDHVREAWIELKHPDEDDPVIHISKPANGMTFDDLDYVEYTVRVKFVDLWDRESEWSDPVIGIPTETADYKINLAKAQAGGRLSGLISTINANVLAGEDFAENTVKAIALAQPDASNLLPLREVDFDVWPDQQEWSPPDTTVGGVKYITHAAYSGVTGKVVDRNGLKWLAVTRDISATSGQYAPFASWGQRGTYQGENYIVSAYADGTAGGQVKIRVETAIDASGTDVVAVESEQFTLDDTLGGKRVFVKFPMTQSHPYMRIVLDNLTSASTVYWTRFQLERAGNKIEPSAWTPGVFSTGVISARTIGAIDLTAANAIFKNASMRSAAIETLVADKIVGGIINTTTINIASELNIAAGGRLKAGTGTTLDDGGVELVPGTSYNTPAFNRSQKISDTSGKMALAFFQDPGGDWAGTVIRSDGSAGGRDGIITLQATGDGNSAGGDTGWVDIVSTSTGGYLHCHSYAYFESAVYFRGEIIFEPGHDGWIYLPDDSVRTEHIINGHVTNAKLANNSVWAWNIQDGQIGTAELGTGAVSNAKIADGAVTNGKIGSQAVDYYKIADDQIYARHIWDGQIGDLQISSSIKNPAFASYGLRALSSYYNDYNGNSVSAAPAWHWHDYSTNVGGYYYPGTTEYS